MFNLNRPHFFKWTHISKSFIIFEAEISSCSVSSVPRWVRRASIQVRAFSLFTLQQGLFVLNQLTIPRDSFGNKVLISFTSKTIPPFLLRSVARTTTMKLLSPFFSSVNITLPACCDLLKIHYLCGDKDNYQDVFSSCRVVVICSKFITFAVTKTTRTNSSRSGSGCDLLKIHYLCGDKDNLCAMAHFELTVVICSKFITFAVTKTTQRRERRCTNGL